MHNKGKSPLCIVNGPLITRGNQVLTSLNSGVFLEDLSKQSGSLKLIQYYLRHSDSHHEGGLHAFDINMIKEISNEGTVYHPTHPIRKHIDRLFAYFQLWRKIKSVPWVYIFLPGRFPAFAGHLSIIRNIPFGIYVRGPVDVNDKRSRKLLLHAKLIVCNNTKTASELNHINGTVRIARPMMDVTQNDILLNKKIKDKGPFNILFVGRVSQIQKGIQDLYDSLLILRSLRSDFTVTLIGSGDLADFSRVPKELHDHIALPGFVSDQQELASYYKAADMFVLPSYFEGFPRVLYEAMTFRLPIATTMVDGIPAIMTDDVNCKELEPGNVALLAETINHMLDNSALRAKLSQASMKTIQRVHANPAETHADILMRDLVS